MKLFLIVCLFILHIISLNLWSKECGYGTVVQVRGTVTKLPPGNKNASIVKKHQCIVEKTSIVTQKKSFVKIKFIDNSSLSIKPESKIIIEKVSKKKSSVFSLLKGHLRASVIKQAKKDKVIIRTRDAAMGVRGTAFEAMYNPDNKISSIITLQGKVNMIKIKSERSVLKEEIVKVEKKVGNKITSTTKVEKVFVRKPVILDESKVAALFDEKESVEISRGRYASVVKNLNRPTIPVKISPAQFKVMENKLYKDQPADKKYAKREAVSEKQLDIDDPNPEGFYDKSTQAYAPRAGGYVDFETGLYIPPNKNAKFDPKENVFVPSSKMGSINKENGDYVPPKGLDLDPQKGFIVDQKESKKNHLNERKLMAMADVLNDKVLDEVVAPSNKVVIEEVIIVEEKKRDVKKHTLKLKYAFLKQKMKVMPPAGNSKTFDSEVGNKFELTWLRKMSDKFKLGIKFAYKSLSYSDPSNITYRQSSDSFLTWGLVSKLSFSKRLAINLDLLLDEDPLIVKADSLIVKKTRTPKVSVDLEGYIFTNESFGLFGDLGAKFFMSTDSGGVDRGGGIGFFGELGGSIFLDPDMDLGFSIFAGQESLEITSSKNKVIRKDIGMAIKFEMDF